MARHAVIIHSIDHARAALAAATRLNHPIVLYSAAGAVAYAGAGWFQAVIAAARADYPTAQCEAILDCGTHAGLALAALRAGCPAIVVRGPSAQRRKIAEVAAARGARLDAGTPDALDLGRCRDPQVAVAAWLGSPPGPKARPQRGKPVLTTT